MTHPMFEGLPTEGAAEYELTELQYETPVKGDNFKLYVYAYEGGAKHGGAFWFTSGRIKYPDEQIPLADARMLVEYHGLAMKEEVRITDGGDRLVAHWKGGEQLYPAADVDFWSLV